MRLPEGLESLVHQGIVDEVVRPLMSGKEAQVYLVLCRGEERVAKVYKNAQHRSFQNRANYTEGRSVRNSRDQRAIDNRSKHGRAQEEHAWRSTEVDTIYRLRSAGVCVPNPYHFIEGVLLMELVTGKDGYPAPRLSESAMNRDLALRVYEHLLREVVRMLHVGVVHGDLSEFNVLMSHNGPVIIDFPQAINASRNQNARRILLRDVDNLYRFVQRYNPGQPKRLFGEEMWRLYERGELTPTTVLSGNFSPSARPANTRAVQSIVNDARREREALSPRRSNGPRRRRPKRRF